MFTRTEKGLRLVDELNLGADRKMATRVGPQRMLGRRIVAREPEGFEALVATIRQRDAADKRARLWERSFFLLAWMVATATAAVVLAWTKGGL